MRNACSLVLGLSLAVVTAGPVSAQYRGTERAGPARDYQAGWLQRFFLGDMHREYWGRPVEVPVLDLETYAGGLTPIRRGGGRQTPSIRLRGADGQVYTFRSLDKDASRGLEPELQESLAAWVLQDHVAAVFPMSALVVAPLLEAADVLHSDPELVVMPDDPALGDFAEDFGGLLGWIEVRPDEGPDGQPGFAGSSRVSGSDAFLEDLEDSARNRVDAEAFLEARLMDLYVGDWDRHPDQWRWAAFEDGDETVWAPVPRDRDWAFSRIDGYLWDLARPLLPNYVTFEEEYGSIFGTTWTGRALDRQLLSSLDRDDWIRITADLQSVLTDHVIEDAVAQLPPEYRDDAGVRLRRALINRRNRMMSAALEYYELLAGWVDVVATDDDEIATVTRAGDGSVTVEITESGAEAPHFHRRFDPAETKEVRLFLRGGADLTRVEGEAGGGITVRVLGGGGNDRYVDVTGGDGIAIYDHRGRNDFSGAPDTRVDESDYEEPDDLESATHRARPRDWGARWYGFPLLGANSDVGLFLGQTSWRETYGFRHFPYRTRLASTIALNPIEAGIQGQVSYAFPFARTGPRGRVEVAGSTRQVGHYFGAGNAEIEDPDAGPNRADRTVFGADLMILPVESEEWSLELGPVFRYSTDVASDGRRVGEEQPYGFDGFSAFGITGEVNRDTRDVPGFASRGGLVSIEGRYYPALADVVTAYGGVRASVSTNLTLWSGSVLSLKARGEKVWGAYPYFDGALLGGTGTMRGFEQDRFVGDASAMGSAQLRVPLSRFGGLLPATVGLHGLVDAGRVFLRGEDSDTWHVAYGGGLWASIVSPRYTLGLTFASSGDGSRFYLSMGFGY